ncbi:MAG: hypothetical protein HY347_06260 [candidate division NC10 bacterium]|nr:hypothetical protein [candidate division NC10 bacterium]
MGEQDQKGQRSCRLEQAGSGGGQGEKGHRCTEVLLRLLALKERLEKLRLFLGLAGMSLLIISAGGLFLLASSEGISTPMLAYTSGLSMAFLPSTLPSLLIVIPLTVQRGYRKGAVMAALFGMGLAVTQAMYGVLDAHFGRILYLDRVTLGMWGLAGIIAYHVGLMELGLLRRRPRFPSLRVREDTLLPLSLGILLGNAGQSCPNPAFYTILDGIASGRNPFSGAFLGLLHGVGRVTFLIGLTFVVLIASSTGGWWRRRQGRKGWVWIGLAALLLPKAFLGQKWWEESLLHQHWNSLIGLALGPRLAESGSIPTMPGYTQHSGPWPLYGPWALVLILGAVPILWRQMRMAGENSAKGDRPA